MAAMFRTCLALLLVCSASPLASAWGESAPEGSGESRAVQLFEESRVSYREGRYEEAARLLEQAYALDADPVLLYNLARTYERMGERRRAIDIYGRYLELQPGAADRPAVETRVRALEEELAAEPEPGEVEEAPEEAPEGVEPPSGEAPEEAPEEPPEEAPEEPPEEAPEEPPEERPEPGAPERPFPLGVAPLTLAAAGAATLIAGGILGGFAWVAREDAAADSSFMSAYDSLQEAEAYALAANIAFGIGGAILAAGVAWLLVDLLGPAREGDGEPRGFARALAALGLF